MICFDSRNVNKQVRHNNVCHIDILPGLKAVVRKIKHLRFAQDYTRASSEVNHHSTAADVCTTETDWAV